MSPFTRNLAIVIGIDHYQNGIWPLKTAVNDAQVLAQVLQGKHDYQVRLLVDQEATLTNLRQLLEEELPQQVQSTDRVLFYFAGHGIALNGDDGPAGFLIPQDAQLGKPSTYYPMSQLHDALTDLPCRHFLGIMDCCFAGAFRWSCSRDISTVPQVLHQERYDRYVKDPAWQMITSAAYDQTATDALTSAKNRSVDGDHSPFAAALLAGLQGSADAFPVGQHGQPCGDGVITATELYLYLRDSVEIATQTHTKRQTPGLWPLKRHDKGEFMFLTPGHPLNLPPAPPLDESKNPYRGLESFDEKHSDLFFGREALEEALLAFVNDHPLTVVLGASGTGKSSLVKAGLLPRLRQLGLTGDSQPWYILGPMRPGKSPLVALNSTLADAQLPMIDIPAIAHHKSTIMTPATAVPSRIAAMERLVFQKTLRMLTGIPFAEPSRQPITWVNSTNEQVVSTFSLSIRLKTLVNSLTIWANRFPTAKLLLVIDQAEELITLCRNEYARKLFLQDLAEALVAFPQQFRVVLTLRSDFEPQLQNFALQSHWFDSRFVVPMMSREELRQAIEEPAAKRVMYFEPNTLVDRLIDEVAQMPGALPLLSFTLSELYLRYLRNERAGERNNRAITQEDYEAIGGVMRSLTQRAEQEFDALVQENPDYALTIRHVMLRMVVVGETGLARRRVHLAELEYPEPKQTQVNQVIARFAAARLLVGGQDEEGKRYVEPAHDALIQGWQRLLEWRRSGHEMLILQRLLTPAAEEWKLHWLVLMQKQMPWQRRSNLWQLYWDRRLVSLFLWHTNPRLEVLKPVPRSNNNWFTQLEAEFVQRSIHQQHKTRAIRWGVVSATICVIAGLIGLFQSSDRLMIDANIAEAQLEIAPLDGMIRTIDVANRSQNSLVGWLMEWLGEPVIPPLSKAISVAREKNQLSHYKDHVTAVGFSPNGETIVGTSNDGIVRVWEDQDQMRHLYKIRRTADLAFAISPTGDEIITASQDGLIRLWSIEGQFLRAFEGHQGPVTSVAFSPNGDQILSGGADKTVRLWHRHGELLKTLVGHEAAVTSVAFSPNVDRIASGSEDQTIRLWDLAGKRPGVPIRGHEGAVLSIAFHPHGTKIASGSADATVRFWNFAGDQIVEPFRGHDDAVRAIAFHPNGNSLISGSADRTIRSWDLSGHSLNEPLRGHEDAVTSVAFNPDGNIIISGSEDNTIRLWDWEVEDSAVFALDSKQQQLRDINLSSDGHTVMSVDEDNAIHLWKHRSDHDFGNYQINEDYKHYSQTQTRNNLALHKLSLSHITAIALSPDQRIIATGNQKGTFHLRDLAGRLLHKAGENDCHPCEPIKSIAFHHNLPIIVSSNTGGDVQVWDDQGNLLKASSFLQNKNDFAASVAFVGGKHNTPQIVIGTYRGNIYLWDWKNKTNPVPFPGKAHNAAITAIAADQKTIYTGSRDRTIRLWDFQGHPKSNPLRGHGAEVDAIVIEEQSQAIYSASSDGQVRRWDIQSHSQLKDACQRLADHPILEEQQKIRRICHRITADRQGWLQRETTSPPEVLP